MTLGILKKSEVKVRGEKINEKNIGKEKCTNIGNINIGKNTDIVICDVSSDIKSNVNKKINVIPADKILRCLRIEAGMLNNCALCEGTNKEKFIKCRNKWIDYNYVL